MTELTRIVWKTAPDRAERLKAYCARMGWTQTRVLDAATDQYLDDSIRTERLSEDAQKAKDIRKHEGLTLQLGAIFANLTGLVERLEVGLPQNLSSIGDRIVRDVGARLGTAELRTRILMLGETLSAKFDEWTKAQAEADRRRDANTDERLIRIQQSLDLQAVRGSRRAGHVAAGAVAGLLCLWLIGLLAQGSAPALWLATKLTGEPSRAEAGVLLAGQGLPPNGGPTLATTAQMLKVPSFLRDYNACIVRAQAAVQKPVICRLEMPRVAR